MTFHNVHTGEEIQEEDIVQGIVDNLQQGEYIIGISSMNVYDINNLDNPIYKFSLDATENVEYNFDSNS